MPAAIHPYTRALQRQFGDASTSAPATSAAASTAMGAAGGATLGVLAGLVVGALAGNTGAGAAIGALAGAGVGGIVGYAKAASAADAIATSESTGETPAPAHASSSLPAGPYTNLGKGAKLLAGHTYLMSSASENPTTASQAFQGVGFTVLGAWSTPPAGWPSDDPNMSGAFMAVTAGGAAQTNGQDVTTWATGGASA